MSFLISLPRACVEKKATSSLIYDHSPADIHWKSPDPRVSPASLSPASLVLDPYYALNQQFPDLMWTADYLLVQTDSPNDVHAAWTAYEHATVPLEAQHIAEYTGGLRPGLKATFQAALAELAAYCRVSITVATNFSLNLYGDRRNVAYAQYKLFVVLNHFYGYSIQRLELDYSKQPLVAGPHRQHLRTLFQQTGVNVYMPPLGHVPPADVSADEIYLAGEPAQILLAQKLLEDNLIPRTDTLEKECSVLSFVRDVLRSEFMTEIEQIMLRHGTFIQLPATENIVRVMGTTRQSIENSIGELVRLYGHVYVAEVQAHFDPSLTAQLAALGVSILDTEEGVVVYGPKTNVKQMLEALSSAGHAGVHVSILIEQPLELMDFILGKKQGKILKVVNGTGTQITAEKCHEHNFRLRLSGEDVSSVSAALTLLEAELPAEKSLYIPEVYHKQIIGQGGLAIQQLMRKYNVYMRFANTNKEKYPNAFGDVRADNVVIRCPAKNQDQIDKAALELRQHVAMLAENHHRCTIQLTRNQRRALLAAQSNGLRQIEVNSGAAILLDAEEQRDWQTVEVSGQTRACIDTAVNMLKQLLTSTDYEFRIPWSPNFPRTVGPLSEFSTTVAIPLFLSLSAQVQAFERVQVEGDDTWYSQVVVSVVENVEGELFEDVSEVVTAYLRKHNLDIVDKGRLSAELHVTQISTHVASAVPALPTLPVAAAAGLSSTAIPVSATTSMPTTSAQTTTYAPPTLAALEERSQARASASGLYYSPPHSLRVSDATPADLPPRPPMSAVNWDHSFDDSPVKRRPDGDTSVRLNRRRTTVGRDRFARHRRP